MTRPRPRGRTLGAVSALDRWRGADPRLTDGLLAGLLLAVAQVEVWLSAEVAGRRPETAVAAAAMTVALVWRRSHPLAALAGVMLPFSALGVTGELPTAVFSCRWRCSPCTPSARTPEGIARWSPLRWAWRPWRRRRPGSRTPRSPTSPRRR